MRRSSPRPPLADPFSLERFLGHWHICVTNYGFWTSRTHAAVDYALLPSGEIADTLTFRRRGKPGTLRGVDRQDARTPQHFVWRGAGVLFFIRSPWYVVRIAEDYAWAVTYFARSNVGTKAGLDIYSRTPSLDPLIVKQLVESLRADPFLAPQTTGLFATVQDGVASDHYSAAGIAQSGDA